MNKTPESNTTPTLWDFFQQNPYAPLLALLILIEIVRIFWYLKTETLFPSWDEGRMMTISYKYLQIIGGDNGHKLRRLLNLEAYYPPLYHLLLVPFHAVLGFCEDNHALINSGFLSLLGFSVYKIGLLLYRDQSRAALAGALAVGSAYMLDRMVLPLLDLPQSALVSFSVYLILHSEYFFRRKRTLFFGAVAGLAMLVKWTYFIYIVPLIMIGVVYRLNDRKKTGAWPGGKYNVIHAFLICLFLALPWYLAALPRLWGKVVQYGFKQGTLEGDPTGFSIGALLYYPQALISQITLPFFLLFLLGAWVLVKQGLKREFTLLGAWFIIPFISFTLLNNKDTRYIISLLPAVALISVAALDLIKPGLQKRATVVICAALLFPFQLPIVPNISLGGLPIWQKAVPPRVENWPIAEISEKVLSEKIYPNPVLRVVPNMAELQASSFKFYARKHSRKLLVRDISSRPWEFSSYILLKNKNDYMGSEWTLGKAREFLAAIKENQEEFDRNYELIEKVRTPDGDDVLLYRYTAPEYPGLEKEGLKKQIEKVMTPRLNLPGYRPEIKIEEISPTETARGHLGALHLRVVPEKEGDDSAPLLHLIARNIWLNPSRLAQGEFTPVALESLSPDIDLPFSRLSALIYDRAKKKLKAPPEIEGDRDTLKINAALKRSSSAFLEIELAARIELEEKALFAAVPRIKAGYIVIPHFLYAGLTDNLHQLSPTHGSPFHYKISQVSFDSSRILIK